MSHYAVAVFSNDGDFGDLLAPYNECDDRFKVFKQKPYREIKEDFKEFEKLNPKWTLKMYIKSFGYVRHNNQWGRFINPNGYWDWYTLDGKEYLFEPKDGVVLDDGQYWYRKNDLNWYPDNSDAELDASDFWDAFVERENDDVPSFYNREYFKERYGTKEQYIKEMKRVIPYAFITPDGVWHSPGRVLCFTCSDETYEDWNRYVEEWDIWIASEANPYVSLVDCHI